MALAIGIVACIAAVIAAVYAYLPYRSKQRDDSRTRFVEEREYLAEHRSELTRRALDRHGESDALLPGMLSRPSWTCSVPLPLSDLDIELMARAPDLGSAKLPSLVGKERLPWQNPTQRFQKYSAALGALARPNLFEDLPCYRLLDAQLNSPNASLSVGLTNFFAGIDESEMLAHEFARWIKYHRGSDARIPRLRIRDMVDPFSVADRHAIFSISCLTIRVDERHGTFFLHARDSKAVAIAGSLLHLAPSGVFQPTSDDIQTVRRDASPWLTLCREFAEEYLGIEEARGDAGIALSYDHDPPYASINAAFRSGKMAVYVCGLGLDPLTLCPELVTFARVDAETFDEVFRDLVLRNDEGVLRGRAIRSGRVLGYEFRNETVADLLESNRLSPAARAALVTAWRHRDLVLRS